MRVFRAAYWTDGQGEVVLTREEHATLPDAALMAEAWAEVARAGVDFSGVGGIVIGDWFEP